MSIVYRKSLLVLILLDMICFVRYHGSWETAAFSTHNILEVTVPDI